MTKRVATYVYGVIVLAAASVAVTFRATPGVDSAEVKLLLLLALIGVLAEALALLLPTGGAATSIASLPFLAAALIAPTGIAVILVTVAAGISQLMHRREVLKGAFNVAQTALAMSVAVLAYRVLGGAPLINLRTSSFSEVTIASGLPAIAFICIFFLTNTMSVSGVIALSAQQPVYEVWRKNHLSTLAYEILSAPFVFLFAWVTVSIGPLGAALLGAPVVGLRQLYKTKLELERTHQDLLQLMVKAIEARDPYTSGHSRRVQQYATIIARALGLSGREVERIGFAALLHDVGKIHDVYAPILRKPEKLTPDERAIMRTHSIRSAELVATVSNLKDIVAPVRHHHENWDGSGYPDGLAGERIPLASRIIMFADTIDAMTSDRPYRKALTEVQVRAELIKYRGKQFDPNICDQLLRSPMFGTLFSGNASDVTATRQHRPTPSRPVRVAVGR